MNNWNTNVRMYPPNPTPVTQSEHPHGPIITMGLSLFTLTAVAILYVVWHSEYLFHEKKRGSPPNQVVGA